MQDYNYPNHYDASAQSVDAKTSMVMKRVYLIMTIGLIVTGAISWFCANSGAYLQFMVQNRWAMWLIFGLEFVIVFAFNGIIRKLSPGSAQFIFYIFAALNGLCLAPIFLLYTKVSIAKTFFITAGTFGAMSVYGYTTSKDLTKVGNILFMALIGLIIASLVNIFTKSSTLGWIISVAGVLIFVGLTAWDTQKIKQWAALVPISEVGRMAAIGALSLYLDFINLFLYLLQFFGRSDN